MAEKDAKKIGSVGKMGLDDQVQPAGDESTALAVREGQDLESQGSIGRQYSTQANLDRDDVMMPRLRLAQGLTPEVVNKEAEIGDFVLVGFDPVKEVVFVPVVFGKGRELRDTGDRSVLCKSDDSINGEGDPDGTGNIGVRSCGTCPKAQWTEDKKGNRKPPQCTFFYSYGGWSETHQSQVLVDFRKTHINVAKLLNTFILHKKLGNFAVKLTAQQKTGPNGPFQVPVVKPVSVESDVLETARAAFNV